ncbi:MAG: multiprotein-bridging factor 1 family protein [Burkholderiales bacterium]|jgi:DNA-binding XRE family transcriptional regulator
MVRYTHEQLVKKLLSDPDNKKEYDNLEAEFALAREMISARLKAGKTQEELAHELHTTKSVISRLENAGGAKRHSPTLETLRKYAEALGCKLQVQLVPLK